MDKQRIYNILSQCVDRLMLESEGNNNLELIGQGNQALAQLWRIYSKAEVEIDVLDILRKLEKKHAVISFIPDDNFKLMIKIGTRKFKSNSILGIFQLLEKMEVLKDVE